MNLRTTVGAEVFSVRELAAAAGVEAGQVQHLVDLGHIRALPVGDGRSWIAQAEAVRAGRALAAGALVFAPGDSNAAPGLFDHHAPGAPRTLRAPLAVSSGLHAAALILAIVVTSLGLTSARTTTQATVEREPLRLVFLATPGPGGGGGGGGVRAPKPPPRARREGTRSLSSPLPPRRPPPRPRPVERPREPEPAKAEPLPPVEAPVVASASDPVERAGVLEQSPEPEESRGPGTNGGVGSGAGTGIGEGDGSGIGEGSGGGMGGGPYRPGSGVTPPGLLREVKPAYTEEARRRGVQGEVLMEIVVRRDGSVGDVRVLRGLGHGLDRKAMEAVRQWRFSPARLKGTPVDVLVEVAMEFQLR